MSSKHGLSLNTVTLSVEIGETVVKFMGNRQEKRWGKGLRSITCFNPYYCY
jgi:hypothetical protein